ncbi:MAG TPA: hypothetical protein VNF47_02165 [Streptosporangiaceae bacterium]|nr:hypothetical protein [Streptosporangiaceae bacterium]
MTSASAGEHPEAARSATRLASDGLKAARQAKTGAVIELATHDAGSDWK